METSGALSPVVDLLAAEGCRRGGDRGKENSEAHEVRCVLVVVQSRKEAVRAERHWRDVADRVRVRAEVLELGGGLSRRSC